MLSYVDRWGTEHKLQNDSIRKTRRGIFSVCIFQEHILLSWPSFAPDVPELPGGGIEVNESKEQALIRELEEEADIHCEALSVEKEHTQLVGFYADNDNEFWDYDQTYWRMSPPCLAPHFFEGQKKPKDALKSQWVPMEKIESMNVHALHANALKEILA